MPSWDQPWLSRPELQQLSGLTSTGVTYRLKKAGLGPGRTGLRWKRTRGEAWQLYTMPLYDAARARPLFARAPKARAFDPEGHPGQRRCSRCAGWQPFPDGFGSGSVYCRACSAARYAEYDRTHKETRRRCWKDYRERKKGRAYVPGWRPPGDTAQGAA